MVVAVQWWLFWAAAVAAAVVAGENVTYDGRSLIIGGERKLLFSGSIHYPRSTPEMWPDLIAKAKEGGLDVIQTYVFWNLHEPQPGQYDFSGRYDLVSFIKQVQAQGLYVCLRIGPFVEAEWNYGGLPFWLHDVPDITYRTDNEPFKFYMQNFTTKIVNMMKSESLYASQGGPIILSQVENEYENVERAFGDEGHAYVLWAAKMAVDLGTGVPWVMCKQQDAPDPVINTCNGLRCGETFLGPNSPNKPALWTENWTSFYQAWGTPPVIRSPEDIAFHTTLFIAKNNGSYINYYMYHGGTNFGRTTSNYFITGYYDQAPLDEYGLLRQPKYGHLKELHAAIKSCSTTLLQGNQTNITLGPLQEAYVFQEEQGGCVAFLINNDSVDATLQFRSLSFDVPRNSISILQDCTVDIFNTAKVKTGPNKRVTTTVQTFDSADEWEEFTDVIPNFTDTSLRSNTLLEHTNTTKDQTDYLWYTFSFQPDSSCTEPILHVQTEAHVVRAYTNNIYIGAAHGDRKTKEFTLENPIVLEDGTNNVSILSAMVGLLDSGGHLERKTAGLTEVQIQCTQESYNFTNDYAWGYQVGLVGEQLQIYEEENQDKVNWSEFGSSINQTLTWYKTFFDAPLGDDPIVLNLTTMGKGEAWVNGQSIGRYWISFHTSKGDSSQTLYHVPRSFLKPIRNLLVLFEEEEGGEPLQISLNTISTISLNEHTSKLYA